MTNSLSAQFCEFIPTSFAIYIYHAFTVNDQFIIYITEKYWELTTSE